MVKPTPRRIFIRSYFSLPTDLAAEFRSWPEFVSGDGYSVDLRSAATSEVVTVRFVQIGDEAPEVVVDCAEAALLFDQVLGRVIYALSLHSDDLVVDRHGDVPVTPRATPPI